MGLGLDERARETVEMQYAIRRLLERFSDEAPLMAVFEDLHWADDASLDLLEYLSTRMRGGRTLIMTLARPDLLEARPLWGAGATAHTSVLLNPLNTMDANRAATELLPGADEATVARIVATAEGNPLFIEELVASIQDDAVADDLPPTIHAVLAARIDALPGDAWTALLRAISDWEGVLARRSGQVGGDSRRGRCAGRARDARAHTKELPEPGRGGGGVLLQARPCPRHGLLDTAACIATRAACRHRLRVGGPGEDARRNCVRSWPIIGERAVTLTDPASTS